MDEIKEMQEHKKHHQYVIVKGLKASTTGELSEKFCHMTARCEKSSFAGVHAYQRIL